MRSRDDDRKGSSRDFQVRRPTPVADALSSFLEKSGIAERVEQAGAVEDWPGVVGPQIASVTSARAVTADGTLFVAVKTSSWMNELSLMEPELLRKLNLAPGRAPLKRIRYVLAG
jgi:predicted nucleic acid-binding Zn ribbon protein